MRRNVAILWHASFSILAGAVYFFCVLPRWPELTGQISHSLGTTGRIVCGALTGLAALPVVFILLRSRKPELRIPRLALTLRTASIVAHVLAGVLIVGTTISEIWLSLDSVGPWLFGVYGAAAAIAVLGVFAFYLSFAAELSPRPPKPPKPAKAKRRRGKRGKKGADEEPLADEEVTAGADTEVDSGEAEEADSAQEAPAHVQAEDAAEGEETEASAPAGQEPESDDLPVAEDTVAVEAPRGGIRNRRPSGKSAISRRRRRARGGVALDD